jgi:hypothetical protein
MLAEVEVEAPLLISATPYQAVVEEECTYRTLFL